MQRHVSDSLICTVVSRSDGDHCIICMGGASKIDDVQTTGELLAKRMLERARELKHNSLQTNEILQETSANHEFYMFCNLRLVLTKSGVGRCVLVAREVDCERLLMLWTAIMVGLKISVSTVPVPTPEAMLAEKKRESARKLVTVMEEISKKLKGK